MTKHYGEDNNYDIANTATFLLNKIILSYSNHVASDLFYYQPWISTANSPHATAGGVAGIVLARAQSTVARRVLELIVAIAPRTK